MKSTTGEYSTKYEESPSKSQLSLGQWQAFQARLSPVIITCVIHWRNLRLVRQHPASLHERLCVGGLDHFDERLHRVGFA